MAGLACDLADECHRIAAAIRHGIVMIREWSIRRVLLAVATLVFLAPNVAVANVTVTERTKTYRVTGTTAAELARSMSKRGPYSKAHQSRAWATAARDLRFQIDRDFTNGRCRVTGAVVRMKITYTLPRLSRTARLSARERARWTRMTGLLEKHERVHGRFYKELASKTHRALLRVKPARTCRALDRSALAEVKRLSAEDTKRNQRFDQRDGRNYRRMNRIFSNS